MKFDRETYKIIDAAVEVYRNLGTGFMEAVYQEALEKEFALQKIPFRREIPLSIYYKTEPLEKKYLPDFVCFDKIIVELRSVQKLAGEHQAQVMNYLKASQFEAGLLFNFGAQSLEHKRLICNPSVCSILPG
ncbi:MAG: GxxExxY protein [Treponema sp.]|nr:GxxExxY protein [Treponema sp.]